VRLVFLAGRWRCARGVMGVGGAGIGSGAVNGTGAGVDHGNGSGNTIATLAEAI
jgi:hypothetical protein